MRILVVEDHPETVEMVAAALREVGWVVDCVADLKTATVRLSTTEYAAVVLDWMLPDGTGIDLCRALRETGHRAAILMLTARGDVADRVAGLEAGADDYLRKPFAVAELIARVRALQRRRDQAPPPKMLLGSAEIDSIRRRVTVEGREVALTAREFSLLMVLLADRGRALSRGEILDAVWGEETPGAAASLEVLISRLRRKLSTPDTPCPIQTHRSYGYSRVRLRTVLPRPDHALRGSGGRSRAICGGSDRSPAWGPDRNGPQRLGRRAGQHSHPVAEHAGLSRRIFAVYFRALRPPRRRREAGPGRPRPPGGSGAASGGQAASPRATDHRAGRGRHPRQLRQRAGQHRRHRRQYRRRCRQRVVDGDRPDGRGQHRRRLAPVRHDHQRFPPGGLRLQPRRRRDLDLSRRAAAGAVPQRSGAGGRQRRHLLLQLAVDGLVGGDVHLDRQGRQLDRADPNGTEAQPEDDHTILGVSCFVTGQGAAGGGLGDEDVDGGKTTLVSPVFDLTGLSDPSLGYWRWYSNDKGNAPGADVFRVDISDDDGVSWTPAETVGPTGTESVGGWFFHTLRVNDFVTATSQVRLRFVAEDAGDGSIVEAAVDDVVVVDCVDCGATIPAQPAGLSVTRVAASTVADLSWGAVVGADEYNLYRGEQPDASDLACFESGILGTSTQDDGLLPPSGEGLYYVVSAGNCAGESSLGSGRLPVTACP